MTAGISHSVAIFSYHPSGQLMQLLAFNHWLFCPPTVRVVLETVFSATNLYLNSSLVQVE